MKKYLRLFAVMAILSGLIIAQIGQVSGQSNALAINPRKDYVLKPGESVQDTLTVTNSNQEEPLNLKLTVVDFEAQDESGTPNLLRESNNQIPWSLKEFIEMPQQVTINPGETIRIPITVSAPSDIGAGSYYSAIEYSAVSPESKEQVNIAASGVSLVFVKVPGQAKQQLTLVQFGAFIPDNSGKNGSFKGLYFGEQPKVLAYRLKNDGNIAEQPNASIEVKDFSGNTVYMIEDANPKDQLALRGQTRRFDACINPEEVTQTTESGNDINSLVCGETNKFKPGRYTAELTIVYGENGNVTQEITAKTTFWYLPWWFLGIVVLIIALIAGAGVYIWHRIQSYRSRKTRRR